MKAIERLKAAATRRGVMFQVSRLAGLNHVTIAKIVTGKTQNPGVHTMAAIERALDALESEGAVAEAGKTEAV
jgi:transcriptional regulator with XRE-family HTH domain